MMVDALIVAAQSEDSEYFEDKDEVPQVPQQQQRTQSQVRICEFCGSSNTPTWRRGPGGKGSLCNACGIKWRLRKRTKKGDHPVEKVKSTKAPATKRRRREKDMDETNHMTTLRHPITFKETSNVTSNNNNNHINTMNHHHSHPSLSIYINDEEDRNSDGKKSYYCKFCNKTFNHTHFKNSQQFGAHCSNCSRRPSLSNQDGIVPYESDPLSSPSSSSSSSSSSSYSPLKRPFHYLSSPSSSPSPSPSPSYYEAISNRNPSKRLFAPPPYEDPGYNLLLILRIMQDELADFEEEASRLAAAANNSTPSLPSISSLSSHSHSHSHPIPASPYSHSHSHSHSLSSHSLSARPHVMITPTPVL